MFHYLHFPECRDWSLKDVVTRLKAEGLIAPGTYWCECPTVAEFWRALQGVTL